ncbi:radical SAM protein [Candidatus Dependentiae bacterium]|nr:radical SAM protein [Candidatus Dependentiae bacterium]
MNRIKKIILINPPNIYKNGLSLTLKRVNIPLGLAYISSVLKNDYELSVIDALANDFNNKEYYCENYTYVGTNIDVLKKQIADYAPDAAAITCNLTTQHDMLIKTAEIIKQINKNIIVIAGGQHPTLLYDKILKNTNFIDYIILSEGENTIKKLFHNLNNSIDVTNLNGIAYKKNDGIIFNSTPDIIQNLDEIQFPSWNLFPIEKYIQLGAPQNSFSKSKRCMPVITSRGCPFKCIFCSTHKHWRGTYRKRSIDNVIKEILYLKNDFDIEEVQFLDDNLTIDLNFAKQLFKELKKLNIYWCAPNGISPNSVDSEALSLMKDSGCYEIAFAIESGSQYVLNNIIKKNVDLKNASNILAEAKKCGLYTHIYLITGFPEETSGQINETLCYPIKNLKNIDNPHISVATPFPGTELYNLCLKQKIIDENNSDYKTLELYNSCISTTEFNSADLLKKINFLLLKFHIFKCIFEPKCIYKNYIKKIFYDKKKFFYVLIEFIKGVFK